MPGSRRSQRQRAVAELRAQGRYGPELRDVLPAFVGLAFAVAGPVALLVWLHHALGIGGLVLGVALLAAATVVGLRWRRAAVRRRGGIYTPAELAVLDEHGLVAAAERMLGRDGWHVIAMPDEGRPRLYARDRGGRQLDVGFRPADEAVDEDVPTGPAPLREAGRPGVDNLIRVVVSRGSYSRADVLWASRQGGVHLVDGRQLQQWAAGESLDGLGLPG
ncbi:hypothetical protein [Streptomyces sp. NBC_01373]|uniref:hypothetical protein n=1 Tax=Streptomyces sp. NBC_01373 TaxID=2903843 RepID=UPI002251F3AE|nr:hypothetical protein [Streptomyces sp. NBC_01373]MCX4707158.1 hypothetical protein [Streptomyces sp. NBC_01373]